MFSDPSMFASPGEGPSDALFQAHAWCIPELVPGAADVEGAALRVEVDAPPVERRLNPERYADGFAKRCGGPNGPDREMNARRLNARHVRHQLHQLIQRRHFPAGKDVRAVGCARNFAAESKPLDEIVNVGEMVVDLAASQHRKA